MFKYIQGKQHQGFSSLYGGHESLLIWLNNIPLSHGHYAEKYKITPTKAGFCNLNFDTPQFHFFSVYGGSIALDVNSEDMDLAGVNQFIRENNIAFDEENYTALITTAPIASDSIDYLTMLSMFKDVMNKINGVS